MPLKPYFEFVRFSHTVFALPFALLSAAMAAYLDPPPLRYWAGIVLAMVAGRTVAMGYNRIADRFIDALNPRTRMRHLPAGTLSLKSAVGMTLLSAMIFVASTLLFLPENPWPLILSIPVLAFLCLYSYTKRFTALAHFWLGAALMLAPVSAWIAVRGPDVVSDPWDLLPALCLGLGVLFWVAGFDIIYALLDVTFDTEAGVYSIPGRWGLPRAIWCARCSHFVAFLFFALLPLVYPEFGWIYLSGVLGIGALLVYEHAIVRPDDVARINQAFFQVNTIISLGLLFVGLLDLFLLANAAVGG